MIKRKLEKKIGEMIKSFPVVAVIGPRQSGKTTLVRNYFDDFEYRNLEEPDTRLFALEDPRAFLETNKKGIIIDEAQRAPEIFSYIQTIADSTKNKTKFILSGSHNFLLHNQIAQSLAGRVAILTLLPFSFVELNNKYLINDINEYIYKGFYPPIYDKKIKPEDWYPNYIQTYIEKDVRLIKNITDLNNFTLFVRLCAGRIGQILNLTSLANETGISVNTAKSWLSILEASYIIFMLQPHHQNFNKRLIKMPKLYFYDTGLACSLLRIENSEQLKTYHQTGSLFENLILSDIIKQRYNDGKRNNLFFWRDKTGNEIDCILDYGLNKKIIEIKSGKTISSHWLKSLEYYLSISTESDKQIESFCIYGGNENQKRNGHNILTWKEIGQINV